MLQINSNRSVTFKGYNFLLATALLVPVIVNFKSCRDLIPSNYQKVFLETPGSTFSMPLYIKREKND